MDINIIRKDFPILERKINDNKLIYLDNSATTQKPNSVIDAISNYYRNYNSNIHRSVYTLGTESENIYDNSKEVVKKFINADEREEIIYTSGTTESINLISRMLEEFISEEDEIIISSIEHHANFVPWQELSKRKNAKLVILEVDSSGKIDINKLNNLITERTKVVSLTYVSNVLGVINPIEEIGKLLKDKNIYFVVDAAQAVPHLSVDVQKLNCDFLVFSGHKMCGPTGIGVLYGKKSILETLQPAKFGGGMIGIVEDYNSNWASIPDRFEAGTPLLSQAEGLRAAVDYLDNMGMNNIKEYTSKLTEYLINGMREIEGITIYGDTNYKNRVSLVSFNLDDVHPHDLASFLDEKGICVRAGHQCTQPLLKRLDTYSVARVSLYFYNTKEEIDIFLDTLKEVKEFFANELF